MDICQERGCTGLDRYGGGRGRNKQLWTVVQRYPNHFGILKPIFKSK